MLYTPEGQQLSCSSFFDELGTRLNDTVNDATDLKFSFYSAHDMTVSAFLFCLNATEAGPQPPFASTIMFELWKEQDGSHTVHTIFDDVRLILPGCDGQLNCALDKF